MDEKRVQRDGERAARLLAFIKGEVADLYVLARMDLVTDLFDYLMPEIKVLTQQRRIRPPAAPKEQ